MSHALAGFVAEPGSDQFVVTPHGAVEEDQRRTRKPGLQILGDPGTGSEKVEILPSGFVGDAKPPACPPGRASRCFKTAARIELAFQVPTRPAPHRRPPDSRSRPPSRREAPPGSTGRP